MSRWCKAPITLLGRTEEGAKTPSALSVAALLIERLCCCPPYVGGQQHSLSIRRAATDKAEGVLAPSSVLPSSVIGALHHLLMPLFLAILQLDWMGKLG